MERFAHKYRRNGLIKVIVSPDAKSERSFFISGDVLCVSPVLKDYIERPDTIPRDTGINGKGTFTFNTGVDVMTAVLEYLREKHGDNNFISQSSKRSTVFFLHLYKMALCLGLEDLCKTALGGLRSNKQTPSDFLRIVAVQAARLQIIENRDFRHWFMEYFNKRYEDLVKAVPGDSDDAWLVRILVSALALTEKGSSSPSSPPLTPPSSSLRIRKQGAESTTSKQNPEQSPFEGKANTDARAKKRKYNATVEATSDLD